MHPNQARLVVAATLAAVLAAPLSAVQAGQDAQSLEAIQAAIQSFGVDSRTAEAAANEAATQIELKKAEDARSAATTQVPAHLLIDLEL